MHFFFAGGSPEAKSSSSPPAGRPPSPLPRRGLLLLSRSLTNSPGGKVRSGDSEGSEAFPVEVLRETQWHLSQGRLQARYGMRLMA